MFSSTDCFKLDQAIQLGFNNDGLQIKHSEGKSPAKMQVDCNNFCHVSSLFKRLMKFTAFLVVDCADLICSFQEAL